MKSFCISKNSIGLGFDFYAVMNDPNIRVHSDNKLATTELSRGNGGGAAGSPGLQPREGRMYRDSRMSTRTIHGFSGSEHPSNAIDTQAY